MPYDAGVAKMLSAEMHAKINGGRVERIHQPSKEEINFLVYSNKERYRLVFDMDVNSPKVYLSQEVRDNPVNPPMFLTLLRKYLSNAKIKGVRQLGFDRTMEFAFDSADDMGFIKTFYLYAEMIRKQSNLILCDESGKIIALLKHVDFSLSLIRQVIPGMVYSEPEQADKQNPFDISKEIFISLLDTSPKELTVEKFFLSNFRGFSTLISREIAYRAGRETDCLISQTDGEKLWFYFNQLIETLAENKSEPCVVEDRQGKPLDFSFMPIRQYENAAIVKTFTSMSDAVEYFFLNRDRERQLRQKSQDILKILTNSESRLRKKLVLHERELTDCAGKEKYRIYGDLITANIYRLKKGDKTAEVENFYEDGETVSIPLEINLTPSQNSQKYYKKYNKMKTAEIHLARQIKEAQEDLTYIDSIFDVLTRALSDKELAEIRDELSESGLTAKKTAVKLPQGKKPPKIAPLSKPLEFISPNGFKILCGKNNKQNDNLTFKTASKNDLWFHVQKIAGSHCVLFSEKQNNSNGITSPQPKDIEEAARIAAVNSKGKNLPFVPVDYAYIKNVKKPPASKPGFVIYDNFKTVTVKINN